MTQDFELYNLSNNKNHSVYGQIQCVDKNNFLLFGEIQTKTLASNLPDKNYDIFYKSVNLDNLSSNKTLNPSNNSGYSEHPHIALLGNNIYWIILLNDEIFIVH